MEVWRPDAFRLSWVSAVAGAFDAVAVVAAAAFAFAAVVAVIVAAGAAAAAAGVAVAAPSGSEPDPGQQALKVGGIPSEIRRVVEACSLALAAAAVVAVVVASIRLLLDCS